MIYSLHKYFRNQVPLMVEVRTEENAHLKVNSNLT